MSVNGGLTVIGFIHINTGESAATKNDLERAKTAGAQGVRIEEHTSNKASLKEATEWCVELGLKLSWIVNLLEPKEKNETSKKTLLEQIAELTTPQKAVIALLEHGNEEFPGGAAAEYKITGKTMVGWFCTIAAELITAGVTIPFGLQAVVSPNAAQDEWMEEVVNGVTVATLKAALIGTGTEAAPNNRLVFHAYGAKMTLAELRPNDIFTNTSSFEHEAGEADPVPSGGNKWGNQRWIKVQQFVKEKTTLTVPVAITEHGVRTEHETGEEAYWVVPSMAVLSQYMEAFFTFCAKVGKGEVSSATLPTGLTPVLALACWYDMYRSGKEESYGIMSSAGVPNEESGVYAKFKAGVEALAAAPPVALNAARSAGAAGRQAVFRSMYR